MHPTLILHTLSFLLICSLRATSGSKAEQQLQQTLFKNHDATSIPIKNVSEILMVNFDIALRSVQKLNEKSQTLDIAAWIRITWIDEFLTWDPSNYSGVHTINVERNKVWKPEVVLYNSADPEDSNLLFDKMTTNVIIMHNGSVSWLAPVLLQSECTIDLLHFPFDTQRCPLTFGLWTVPFSIGPRINLTLVNNYGDIANYKSNGVFQLNGMPGRSELVYFPCCPGVPYVRLQYEVLLQRRTVFYFVDFFFPSLVINILLLVSYTLPPECGERITFSVSLLLALVLHMMHVADSIPPTSNAVPMVTKFLSISVAFSAVSMIISAIAVSWFLSRKSADGKIPWAIRVMANGYVSRLLCVQPQQQPTRGPPADVRKENGRSDREEVNHVCSESDAAVLDSVRLRFPQQKENGTAGFITRLAAHSNDQGWNVLSAFRLIMHQFEEKELEEEYEGVVRRAVCALDRFATISMLIVTIICGIYLMFIGTQTYIK